MTGTIGTGPLAAPTAARWNGRGARNSAPPGAGRSHDSPSISSHAWFLTNSRAAPIGLNAAVNWPVFAIPIARSITSTSASIRKINRSLLFDLATGMFIQKREDALFLGPGGTDKSHLAQAIGQAVILQGYKVLYRETHVLLDELAEAVTDGTRKECIESISTVPLLIIDDFCMRKVPQCRRGFTGNHHAPLHALEHYEVYVDEGR